MHKLYVENIDISMYDLNGHFIVYSKQTYQPLNNVFFIQIPNIGPSKGKFRYLILGHFRL